jgi:ribonuclease HI
VRGHDGNPGNELADQLANRGVDSVQGRGEFAAGRRA